MVWNVLIFSFRVVIASIFCQNLSYLVDPYRPVLPDATVLPS